MMMAHKRCILLLAPNGGVATCGRAYVESHLTFWALNCLGHKDDATLEGFALQYHHPVLTVAHASGDPIPKPTNKGTLACCTSCRVFCGL